MKTLTVGKHKIKFNERDYKTLLTHFNPKHLTRTLFSNYEIKKPCVCKQYKIDKNARDLLINLDCLRCPFKSTSKNIPICVDIFREIVKELSIDYKIFYLGTMSLQILDPYNTSLRKAGLYITKIHDYIIEHTV